MDNWSLSFGNVMDGRDRSLYIIILFSFLLLITSCVDNPSYIKPLSYYSNLEQEIILPGTEMPLDEAKFQGACWAMEISQYRSREMIDRLKFIYGGLDTLSYAVNRSFWEAVNALYPTEFITEAKDYLMSRDMSENYKLTAMACQYLYHSDNGDSSMAFIHDYVSSSITTQKEYDNYMNDPIFKPWVKHVFKHVDMPDYQALFNLDLGNYPTIYVVFRENRDFPGIALLKNEKGEWVRSGDGIFYTRILGRSMSNLYGTITNGNTPQGIYTLIGIDGSDNVFIGPTPTIITGLPIEYSKSEFFHEDLTGEWEMDDYLDLLPDSWKEYIHFHEAWYAGKAGRSEIIMHGSTILPELYENEPYYPLTPSLGCLTHYEKWSKNGRLIKSDQQKMVDALMACSTQQGFMVVVELNDEEKAVELEDIRGFIK